MRIQRITLQHIRNHAETTIEPAPEGNIFCGFNGHGKTSILEAIALCALSTSFVPGDDKSLIAHANNSAIAQINAQTDLLTPYKVAVKISTAERKHIFSSLGKRLSPQDIIGEIPLVVLSPDFKSITAGSPAERRRFVDSLLSQSNKLYMADMLALKKILKQRNTLLHAAKHGHKPDAALLDSWTESLITTSVNIVIKRHTFVEKFKPYIFSAYRDISGGREQINVSYQPDVLPSELLSSLPDVAELIEHYQKTFEKVRAQELHRGTTVCGPQKDEFVFWIHNAVVRETASQGQHKSLLIALKSAEYAYLAENRQETPVVLLDDVFSELDAQRAANVFQLLRSGAQTFITTTDESLFIKHFRGLPNHALFFVENGLVRRIE